MPEVATRARDDVAVAAIQDILKQEDYNPKFLRDLIKACQTANQTLPSPEAIIINGKPYPVRAIREHLAKFVYMLPQEKRPAFNDESLYDDSFLENLSGIIDQVSGFTPAPPPANIPQDLKNLVAEFDKAQQASVSAQAKRHGWSPEEFRKQIALQDKITIQMHQVRQYTLSQLEWTINNSTALENLAASLGRRPEVVKRLALIRAKALVDKEITAQTFRQTLLYNKIKDPVLLASLYTNQLKNDLLKDDLLILAAVDKDPKTKQKYLDTALKKTKETVAQETEKAKPAIQAAAKNLEEHPTNRKAAQADAIAAIKQVETVSLNRQPLQQLKPATALRLAEALARHPDNPDRQERIIRSALGATSAQAKVIRYQLPQINQLASSSAKPNYLAMADPDSIFNDISLHPNRFPRPLVDAVRSGRISDPGKLADAIIISRTLNIPLEAVVLSQWGVDAQNLAAGWKQSPKFLWIIPMGHSVDSKDPDVIKLTAKLAGLEPAQKQLADSLKTPPPLLPPQIPKQFLKTVAQNSRAVHFNQFTENLNPFRLFTAISYNLNRIPSISSIGNAGSGFFSGLQVRSPAVNFIFNAYNTFTGGIPQIPSIATSFITSPFRAVGSAISNTIINPVKTWANTQIKSGLAKAGAWLAKKGITEGAKKVGMALLGKGTAALLAQAVPVAGQIFAAALIGGDILKFLWEHKDKIGMALGGMFLLGQMLLGKILAFLGSAAWTLGGAALGFALGGPIGAAIGGTLGWLIGSGALGSVLSGLGAALGSAAAGLSSFIGALTAPSLVAGLASTITSVSIFVSLGVGGYLIFQNQRTMFSGLYVAPDEGTFPPGSGPGGGGPPPNVNAQCSDISGIKYCFPVVPLSGVSFHCGHHDYPAADIFTNGDQPPTTDDQHLPVVAYIGGTVYWISDADAAGGIAFNIEGDDGRYYYYAHNYVNYVTLGQRVETGQVVALTDTTGNAAGTWEHLHFGISSISDMRTRLCRPPTIISNCVSAAIRQRNINAMIAPTSPGNGGDFQEKLGISCPQGNPPG